MDKKRPGAVLCPLLVIFILFSCASQENYYPFPAPDKSLYENERPINIDIENVTDSKDMGEYPDLPPWLSAYLYGGINEAEQLEEYSGRYLFIAVSQGINFAALNKWADNFSIEHDFPMLAAARIEKRMNVSNSMYPDEEYGIFYETLVKNAFTGEYRGTVKEDTYWIKLKAENGASSTETFVFYILISVDMEELQNTIYNFYSQALASSSPAKAQVTAINRLRQIFFEGF